MEMMLQTKNQCKYFRKQKAVNNVSLNIEKGQIYGLLGPNGAGKSTTLKMLTGMMKPTAGKIYFDGKLLDRKDLSKIGALIENPPIYENLSARENLKVRQLLLGTDENRIDEVLQIVSLTNTGKKKAGQFSLGMNEQLMHLRDAMTATLVGAPSRPRHSLRRRCRRTYPRHLSGNADALPAQRGKWLLRWSGAVPRHHHEIP